MDDITKIMIGNLTATILAALDELGAPQDTKDALTENGDLEHVHWWITEGRGLPKLAMSHGEDGAQSPRDLPPLAP